MKHHLGQVVISSSKLLIISTGTKERPNLRPPNYMPGCNALRQASILGLACLRILSARLLGSRQSSAILMPFLARFSQFHPGQNMTPPRQGLPGQRQAAIQDRNLFSIPLGGRGLDHLFYVRKARWVRSPENFTQKGDGRCVKMTRYLIACSSPLGGLPGQDSSISLAVSFSAWLRSQAGAGTASSAFCIVSQGVAVFQKKIRGAA